MKTRDLVDLVLLAALWGASFLFMRVSVPEFGAVPMMTVRVALAGVFLLPLVYWKKRQETMLNNIIPITLVGVFNSALPFSLIAYSTLYVTAGFASILNAATPMFTAIIAFIWLSQRLNKMAVLGLIIGLAGVILLVWNKVSFTESSRGIAILAGLAGAVSYAIGAAYTKKKLVGIDALSITTGSQLASAVLLLPLAILWWPSQMPTMASWVNVFVLAIACTGIAQILYFRLIERTGAANATTVTFLIPIFGLFWGYVFLDETISYQTFLACGVILLGTAMTIGIVKPLQTAKRST